MTCLIRIAFARLRHLNRSNKVLLARYRHWFDGGMTFNLCFIVPSLIWYYSQQKMLMPIADKYLLVGEDKIMEKVKSQIFYEYSRINIMNMWHKREHLDIELLNEDNPYIESNDDKNKKVMLMLCVSSGSNKKEVRNWIPTCLPLNTEKMTLVETRVADTNAVQHLKKNEQIMELFAKSKFKKVSPVSHASFENRSLDDTSRQFLYVVYALCVSVIFRLNIFPFQKRKTG